MANRPLALSDAELSHIMTACAPLPREQRDGFLRAVATELQAIVEPGPGDIYRSICAAQKRFWDPPLESPRPRSSYSKYR
jgi:hypothetical protein